MSAKGNVHTGFRHIRDNAKDGPGTESQPSRGSDESTLRVMAYMFPRQFGLHNVFTFTPAVGPGQRGAKQTGTDLRLTAGPAASVTGDGTTEDRQARSLADGVSAFCQRVLCKIIPNEVWGVGSVQKHNKELVMENVDRFVRLRRFENMSLHDIYQGMKLTDVEWLAPPHLREYKMSPTDKLKRTEIFLEFLYYVFDSLLIPLIRSNFYVTDSGKHKNRLFYFRHDVWRRIAEPAMVALRADLFEEIKAADARSLLDQRALGTSQLRLLPKDAALRPIMNLRRREFHKGRQVLLPSINSILAPLYSRLKAFAENARGGPVKRFYLAKVDVRAAFDTMPQDAVVELMKTIPSDDRYVISKYVEIKPGDSVPDTCGTALSKPAKRWQSLAATASDETRFASHLESKLATGKKNTIFVSNSMKRVYNTGALATLLTDHVRSNIGSVLSTAFCNYFYADLERRHLAFLADDPGGSLLLRLIDDFLLITTDRSKAERFMAVMHAGLPDYGVTVNPAKSLVNFALEIDSASRRPGHNFERKTLNAFRIQSHMMFFDTAHNPASLSRANLAAAMAETARKACAYIRCLPRDRRPREDVFVRTIGRLVEVAHALLTSRTRKARFPGYECSLSKMQVRIAALGAFSEVVKVKQPGYKGVIDWAEQQMKALESGKSPKHRSQVVS
ncbi:unnamed protein product [Parascedosporium putredinis]|uniref:Telomerase reverse transcriptase n=1 Tax=Parascedosporium putredinis TaxID=1442378 RepID=A0A9P1H4R2_9PEZI|nr:unnamed protein product [Parascedosporium putredinis]CAI7998528.1 unnamed protein product [Parascedosporium putredinis]